MLVTFLVSLFPTRRVHAEACALPLNRDVKVTSPIALRDGLGNSSLEITTTSAEARKFFEQGLNLLHSFWDYEALRAFAKAAELDPQSAMSWWGIAMSIGSQDFPAARSLRTKALERVRSLGESVSEKERFFLEACC